MMSLKVSAITNFFKKRKREDSKKIHSQTPNSYQEPISTSTTIPTTIKKLTCTHISRSLETLSENDTHSLE